MKTYLLKTYQKIVLLTFILLFTTTSFADAPSVEKDDGLYIQLLGSYIKYVVDTKTQLCFGGKDGISVIDCKSLAKRNEWKPIITWLK